MQLPESAASIYLQPIQSLWVGGLYQELADWGYTESAREQLCDFDDYWHMAHIFKHYQMDPKAWYRGGDNACFDMRHGDPQKKRDNGESMPIVEQTYTSNGKQYRATDAFATIGINAVSGHVFFIACKSAGYATRQLWGTFPSNADLPALRSLPHIAWGVWTRLHYPQDVHNIQAFWSLSIVNRKTNTIIDRAHTPYSQNRGPPAGRTLVWPGITFPIDSIEGQATLGLPNGIATGSFLAQHKAQLGDKVISKITVWTASMTEISSLLFLIADELNSNPEEEDPEESKDLPGTATKHVMERSVMAGSGDDRNFVREHVFRARL